MAQLGPARVTTTSDPSMARVARMVAMSVAGHSELGVDAVQDVALATSEAFSVVALSGPEGIAVDVSASDNVVTVVVEATGVRKEGGFMIDPLTARVLDAVTTDIRIDPGQFVRFSVST